MAIEAAITPNKNGAGNGGNAFGFMVASGSAVPDLDRSASRHTRMNEFQIPHDLEEAMKRRREQMFRATLWGQGSQQLATGEAILEGDPPHGTFWPDHPVRADIPPSTAVVLRRSDGTDIPVRDFHRCQVASATEHYHFHGNA